ncbi:hypothetical protein ITJ86_01290 [Winogradskyella sp. F6397]|uniref:Glycosyltransferase family 4 protein n=1 Tax=Winogradskyella marina TaxID=2785530 RepID=A0ABS0EDJ1_9FLAO|nr:hypothetical protein [Winogradskyella marina]MBF8148510.1 hypothetical protein [Winogradskyella marina]
MTILIVAKSYNQQSARAIQMRRVVDALNTYIDANIILITQGDNSEDFESNNFKKININSAFNPKTSRIKQRFFSGLSNFDQNFIEESVKVIDGIVKSQQVDVLLTVSTPIECHNIGLIIKTRNPKIKWISFFSDLWPSHIVPKPLYRKKMGSKKDIDFMSQVAEYSDVIVTPSKYTLEVLKENISSIKAKLETINHCGRDLQHYESKNELSGYLVHSGFLQKERISEDLILAIKKFENDPTFKGFIHIGKYHSNLTKLIKKHNCKKILLIGSVPEELAGSLQEMCHVSMVIEAPMKKRSPFLPSKITDALLFSDKVVCISPEQSALSDMSRKWSGVFAATYDKDKIYNVIKTALASDETIPMELLREISPKTIAAKYLKILQTQ